MHTNVELLKRSTSAAPLGCTAFLMSRCAFFKTVTVAIFIAVIMYKITTLRPDNSYPAANGPRHPSQQWQVLSLRSELILTILMILTILTMHYNVKNG